MLAGNRAPVVPAEIRHHGPTETDFGPLNSCRATDETQMIRRKKDRKKSQGRVTSETLHKPSPSDAIAANDKL